MTAAILDFRPAAPPGQVPPPGVAKDLVRLFALDRPPTGRRHLLCHWRRDAEGRLSCFWEPDIVPVRR
jgi:hypothetical protein